MRGKSGRGNKNTAAGSFLHLNRNSRHKFTLISSQNKLPIPFMISLIDFSACSRKSPKIILSP
jgi:hypothetical protein